MNNIKRIIIIIIMGIVFIPSTVYGAARKSVAQTETKAVEKVIPQSETAAEIPTDGVTYFLIYPNGHEVATESYDEAMNPPEMVIYEGDTNESGEV